MANANAASKLYVCATPQNSNLTQVQYEALAWVEVGGLGSHGETGNSTNMLTYDTWGDAVIQKAKGMTDAGSPEIECARLATDPGQIILNAAGVVGNANNYAFKMLRSDAQGNGNPSVMYNRGLVSGPKRPNGRNEDFDILVWTLGLQQAEIIVNAGAASGNPPVNTVVPAITGTLTVGQTITLGNGTWTGTATITYTYQWFANGVAIPGATANTYVLTSTELGKRIQGMVYASNSVGNALSMSALSAAVT